MSEETFCDTNSEISATATLKTQPWFVTYNPYYVPSTINTYEFDPFPRERFPYESPWEDHVIVSHQGVEPFATKAGYESIDGYIKELIKQAAIN